MSAEKPTLVEVECYDHEGPIIIQSAHDVLRMAQAMKDLGLPGNIIPFVRLLPEGQ